MTAFRGTWQEPVLALMRVCLLALALALACAVAALADDRATLTATEEGGYARLVLNFPARLDLPVYRVKYDNNVLAVEFEQPVR